MYPAERLEALKNIDADNTDTRIASAERSKSFMDPAGDSSGRLRQSVKFHEENSDNWAGGILEEEEPVATEESFMDMVNVREIAYVNWNIQPQPYPFSSVVDGKFRSIKCTWYLDEKRYKYGKTVYHEAPTHTPLTVGSLEFEQESREIYYPPYNM